MLSEGMRKMYQRKSRMLGIALGLMLLMGCTNLKLVLSPYARVGDVPPQVLQNIRLDDLRQIVAVLSSDSLEGRNTPSAGLEKAANFLARQFSQAGLKTVPGAQGFFYPYRVVVKRFAGAPRAWLQTDTGAVEVEFDREFHLSLRHMAAQQDTLAGIVFVGYAIKADSFQYDDFGDLPVEGKILFYYPGTPRDSTGRSRISGRRRDWFASWREKLNRIHDLGAAGAVIIFPTDTAHSFAEETRWMRIRERQGLVSLPDTTKDIVFPVFYLAEDAAQRLFSAVGFDLRKARQEIDATGKPHSKLFPLPVTWHWSYIQTRDTVTVYDVIGYLPGSDPDLAREAVFLSAHYDHLGELDTLIWHGADDNASGTAIVVEVAKALATGPPLKRSVVFLLVSGEEKGLLGSQAYTRHPLWPLDLTAAEINIDMVGRNAPDSIYVIGSDHLSRDLDMAVRIAAHRTPHLELDYRYDDPRDPNRFYYRSDHYHFAENNVPSVFFFAGIHGDYHQPTDTMDKLNFNKLDKVAEMVGRLVTLLANTQQRPRLNGYEVVSGKSASHND